MKLTESEERLIAGGVFFAMASFLGKRVAGTDLVATITAHVIGLFKEMEFDTFNDFEKAFQKEMAEGKAKEAATPSA